MKINIREFQVKKKIYLCSKHLDIVKLLPFFLSDVINSIKLTKNHKPSYILEPVLSGEKKLTKTLFLIILCIMWLKKKCRQNFKTNKKKKDKKKKKRMKENKNNQTNLDFSVRFPFTSPPLLQLLYREISYIVSDRPDKFIYISRPMTIIRSVNYEQ